MNGLKDALAASESQPDIAPDAVVKPCPLQQRQALEVDVVDEAGKPIASIAVRISRNAGAALQQLTGSNGRVRFDGLLPHEAVQLTLPETDQDAWELVSQIALPALEAKSSGDAPWQPPPSAAADQTIEAQPGDCIASLAFGNGWLADSLWNHAANSGLHKELRNEYVLNPGDNVHIPTPRLMNLGASAGNRYKVKRKGVPEMLHIRFLSFCDDPRRDVPYLLTMTSRSGRPIDPRQGNTDHDGFLHEPIPPDAWRGHIVVGTALREELELFLGRINPNSKLSGVQGRLNNLGYDCGAEDGMVSEKTREALIRFQSEWQLPVTGEADAGTKAKLEELFLS